MGQARTRASRFTFGPYEVDVAAGELRKNGLRVRLQGKSFEVLVALLEQVQQVVTRQDLQRRLWPDGVSVDFDNSLNSAVNRLRDVLRDRARNPRYIETLHHRGYRFIAPVEQIPIGPARLAVLPFENLNRQSSQDFFADAVTDALITELGNVSALRVISRQSVLHLKGSRRTVPEIARELGVDAVVEGSVAHAAGRIRATAQLIQAEPEQHLWARAYECEVADLLTTGAHTAKAIAEAIQVALTSGEAARLSRPQPIHPEAHLAYLKARHHIGIWTGENLKKALEYLRSALQKDPTYAPALAHLADCYSGLGFWGHMPFQEAFIRGKDAALKALALDDALSAAHWAFAWITWFFDRDLATCEAEIQRAVESNPSDERAHEIYAMFLAATREDRARAEAEIRTALQLDPLSQRVNTCAAWVYLFIRHYEQAIEQACKTLELFPQSLQCHYSLGLAQLCSGRYADSIAVLERGVAMSQDPLSRVYLACARLRIGDAETALALLNDLLARSTREHVMPRCFVLLHAALGELDRAFEWLDHAYEAHDPGLSLLRVMPLYAPLRCDPRFERMLQRLEPGGGTLGAPTRTSATQAD